MVSWLIDDYDPGISFFLSGWYKRKEASKRISVFFGGAVMAGAFGYVPPLVIVETG